MGAVDLRRMIQLIGIVVAGLYTTLAVVVIAVFIRRVRRGWGRLEPVPYQPVPDVFAPEPVVATAASRGVGGAAVFWSAAHLAAVAVGIAFAVGALPARGMGELAAPFGLAGYVVLAAALTGLGGILLVRATALGRKLICWGQLLFVIAAMWLIAFLVAMPTHHNVPPQLRPYGYWFAGVLLVHAVLDGILGAAARRVGRAGEAKETDLSREERQLLRDWEQMDGGVAS